MRSAAKRALESEMAGDDAVLTSIGCPRDFLCRLTDRDGEAVPDPIRNSVCAGDRGLGDGDERGFDQNVIESVQTWRFDPARKAGKPVRMHATIEVNFRLL